MAKLFIIAVLILFSFHTSAQDSLGVNKTSFKNKHGVFFEVLGKGYVYSFNYENFFYHKKSLKSSFRVGLGYFGARSFDFLAVPYGVNLIIGKKKGHFEIGIAQTLTLYGSRKDTYYYNYYDYKTDWSVVINNSLSFGYKYLPKSDGIYFSAYGMLWLPSLKIYAPSKSNFINGENYYIYPYVGFNFGYIF